MRKRFASTVKDESGVTAVIVAISVTLFVGFLAYVVDIGYAYEMRRQLQSAADSAALAGMTDKVNGEAPDQVLAIAQDYAARNDSVGLPETLDVIPPDDESGQTIVDQPDFVQIAVSKQANYAFAPIFGRDNQMIYAQARAIRTYITGAGDLVPWGLGTVRPTEIKAYVGDNPNPYYLTDGNQDGVWDGSVDAPGTPSPDGYLVDIEVKNGYDYVQTLEDVGRITVDVPGDSVSDVWLGANNLAPSQTAVLSVAAVGRPAVANQPFAGTSFSETFSGSGIWQASLTAPEINNPLESFPIDIKVGSDRYANAAVLVVQTNRSPLTDIVLGQAHWTTPGSGMSLAVTVREFEYGQTYTLKLDGGATAEAGNFGGVDYSTLTHWSNGELEGIDNNANYSDNLVGGYQGIVHLGDSLDTFPGGMGNTTFKALEDRFANCPEDPYPYTLVAWEGDDRPVCGRRITVPVYELTENLNGKKRVTIYSFAAFFIESVVADPSEGTNITGAFIEEYKGFGTSSSDTRPDSGLYMETVRLAKPNY